MTAGNFESTIIYGSDLLNVNTLMMELGNEFELPGQPVRFDTP
jgi:hypothetical protein